MTKIRLFFVIQLLLFLIVLALGLLAVQVKNPFWADYRAKVICLSLLFYLVLIMFEILILRYKKKTEIIIFIILIIVFVNIVNTMAQIAIFSVLKARVLNQKPEKIEKLGKHFIIGYQSFEEIKTLVDKRAIGGVYLKSRNVKGKSFSEIQNEIRALQTARIAQGLPPLWIATDQEGGSVSHLSPPLKQLPSLSKLVFGEKVSEKKIRRYATMQARELSELGINLNFAPVIDLNKGIVDYKDKFSRIYQRAISSDKAVVSKVALWYCKTLAEFGVRCTIKHFPGLGRVETDSHLAEARLQASVTELSKDDWIPFRLLMSQTDAFMMLGHIKLTEIDPNYPASFSSKVVTGLIRTAWQYEGVLITDDFGMQPVYGSKEGVATATVKAINAGVDLILIAHDPDLYYLAISALIKEENAGNLANELLFKSEKRLQKNQ